jgi:hypothetical protein
MGDLLRMTADDHDLVVGVEQPVDDCASDVAGRGPYPLLGRRGRKEDARLPPLPTALPHGQRARPSVAPQTPTPKSPTRADLAQCTISPGQPNTKLTVFVAALLI